MKASVGDRLVQASSVVDGPVRDGRVVELRRDDGSPPYVVEWSDTGERTLVFPGPDAHVEHGGGDGGGDGGSAAGEPPTAAVTWRVQVTVAHDGRETTAQALLVAGGESSLDAVGRARQDPADEPAPRIGEEVAVARALRRLADRLTDTAEEHIQERTGTPARVHG